jgi:hypothetical protein
MEIIIGSLAIFGMFVIIAGAAVAIGDALADWYNRGR